MSVPLPGIVPVCEAQVRLMNLLFQVGSESDFPEKARVKRSTTQKLREFSPGKERISSPSGGCSSAL